MVSQEAAPSALAFDGAASTESLKIRSVAGAALAGNRAQADVVSGLMAAFGKAILQAAAREREVTLTTLGRKTGKPRSVTIWISTDGKRLYIRSGEGLGRDWPQNLLARGEATLRMGGESIKVKPRHVTEPEEARATSHLARKKYGSFVKPSKPGEPLTKGETAVFELIPE
jgi:deazaflavin-dependent oxidoreductase (nitroreductase family)